MSRRWLTNTYDPKRSDAGQYISRTPHERPGEAWSQHLEWLKGKTIGRPKATEKYTVEELEAMHMVGIYAKEDSLK